MKLELQQRRLIEAPIEEAWQVLSDVGRIHGWAPDMSGTELTSEGPVGEGAIRTVTFDKPVLGKKNITERFTEWHQGRGFAYEVQGGMGPFHAMRNQWWLDEKGPHTMLTYNSRMRTKNPLIKLAGPYVRRQAAKTVAPVLDAFKAHVEGGEQGTQRFLQELKQKRQGGGARTRPAGVKAKAPEGRAVLDKAVKNRERAAKPKGSGRSPK